MESAYCMEGRHMVPKEQITSLPMAHPVPGRPVVRRRMCEACKARVIDARSLIKEKQKTLAKQTRTTKIEAETPCKVT